MDVLFLLKKLLGSLLMPVPMILISLALSLYLVRKLEPKYALRCMALVLVLFYTMSIAPVVNWLVQSLEQQHPKYQHQPVDYVLVLGGSHNSDPSRPLSSLLSSVSLARLLEGVMIYRENPGAKLLVSGYRYTDEISNAQAASMLAVELGVPLEDIVLAEEAAHWAAYVTGKPLALVTSAMHMPRAHFLFEREIQSLGLDVNSLIPAPANYMSSSQYHFRWIDLIPKARYLARAAAVWHEYLGCFWARLQAK